MLHGENPASLLATVTDLASAPAFLLIGNDLSEQNPLVAWQVRSAIRHHDSRLYAIDCRETKIMRQAKIRVLIDVSELGASLSELASGAAEGKAQMGDLRSALREEDDLTVLFGSILHGDALEYLANLFEARRAEGKRTRFMALADYANSRGAADMGLLPDLLPGYASLHDATALSSYSELWGCTLPNRAGLSAAGMIEAALSGRLRALYVIGANPVKHVTPEGTERLGRLELLIVQDLFMSESARCADIVLPALCAYEKEGTMTNTGGEVQLLRKGADCMGPRSDFDILRIMSHQLARHGVGQPIGLRTPEAAFAEISQHVSGYDISRTSLLAGGAEPTSPKLLDGGRGVPGEISSNGDSLFTSGSLTEYCRMIRSLQEAGAPR
jgi:NADH-quinone oxidoreductase subunit G